MTKVYNNSESQVKFMSNHSHVGYGTLYWGKKLRVAPEGSDLSPQ